MERRKDSDDNQDDDVSAMDTDGNGRGKILFKKQNTQRSKDGWQKPSFNKSVSVRKQIECTDTKSNECETSEKPTLKGSKVIMPEYVIGQKVTNVKTKKNKLNSSSSTQTSDTKQSKQQSQKPQLHHLFDEDENQDDDGEDVDKMDDN